MHQEVVGQIPLKYYAEKIQDTRKNLDKCQPFTYVPLSDGAFPVDALALKSLHFDD